MDFRFSEDEEMLRSKVRRFAEEKLAPLAAEVDELDEVSWEVARLLGEQGLFSLFIPEGYGGVGLKAMLVCIAREELSRICIHADLLFAEMALCSYPIGTYGTEAQKQKYLPPFSRGETLGSFALTEPEAGSDVANLQTTAVIEGDSYVLNGSKCFASVGPFAQIYVTFAKTDPAQGSRGISAFVIEKGTPGFEGKPMKLMAPHPMAELTFTDCRLPKENLLGEPGRGMRVALSTLDFLRMSVGAAAVGIAQRAYEEAISYSKKRIVFGQSLAEFQSTQFKLADMATDIDAARLLVYRAARVVDQALQLHGGYGVVKGMTVERLYRAIRQPRVYEGTSEIQRIVIARHVLEE
ncbi:MAG: acyl-CoA dehydrogenase family protein [Chloroflexi bacterium]|nr:acyl-CoA dehydrogenase family protein [Chloroflexota bacterium]